MNDVILMSIKGGRYLEAEKETNKIILDNPSDEVYFLMGTVKSNLLLDKGRDFSEVTYCFEKSIELSKNSTETKNQAGTFLLGIHKQLQDISAQIVEQKKVAQKQISQGILATYLSSVVLDNSKSSFGNIAGIVGAGFGVGLAYDGLSNIGGLSAQSIFIKNLRANIESYLINNFPEIKSHFDEIETERLKKLKEKKQIDVYATLWSIACVVSLIFAMFGMGFSLELGGLIYTILTYILFLFAGISFYMWIFSKSKKIKF